MIISRNLAGYRTPAFVFGIFGFYAFIVALVTTFFGFSNILLWLVGGAATGVVTAVLVLIDLEARVKTHFFSWEEVWATLSEKNRLGQLKLIGRDNDQQELESAICDQSIYSIIVSGPPYVGKSRFVLDAAKNWKQRTVISRDAKQLPQNALKLGLLRAPSFFHRNRAPRSEIIVILETPSDEAIRGYVEQSFEIDNIKLIITISAESQIPLAIRHDGRVKVIPLSPLSEEESFEFLNAANVELDYNIRRWIINAAGGYPGILLQAASQGSRLRDSIPEFLHNVADNFEDKLRQGYGLDNQDIKKLQLLSLLQRVNTSGRAGANIDHICSFFWRGIQLSEVVMALDKLEENNTKKSYFGDSEVEIWPPVFGIGLARSLLQDDFARLYELYKTLDEGSRVELIKRLQLVETSATKSLWEKLFDHELVDLKTELLHRNLLYSIAGAAPTRLVEYIATGLKNSDGLLAERINSARVALCDILGDLLLRKQSSYAAVSSLVLLAKAEVDTNAYNATRMLADFFHPNHPQVGYSLDHRLERLNLLCEPKEQERSSSVGIKIIALTVTSPPGGWFRVMPPNGMLFDAPADTTEATTYIEQLNDLLIRAARENSVAGAKIAREALPHGIANLCVRSGLTSGIKRFQTLVSWIENEEVPIPVFDLYRWLEDVKKFAENELEKASAKSAKLEECTRQLEDMTKTIDHGSFFVRLQRWGADTESDFKISKEGILTSRVSNELCLLAQEAVANPILFSEKAKSWLTSEEAKNARDFFKCLGKYDSERQFLGYIEDIGRIEANRPLVGYYFEGVTTSDLQFALNYLNELNKQEGDRKEALSDVIKIAVLSGDHVNLSEVEQLIKNGKVNLSYVGSFIFPKPQLRHLSHDKYEMLENIAGPDFRGAAIVVHMLAPLLTKHEAIDDKVAELLWRCLESAPKVAPQQYYDFDRTASVLAHLDIERAFELFENLLEEPWTSSCWRPIYLRNGLEFWNELQSHDRNRALRVLLRSIYQGQVGIISGKSLIDQDADTDILLQFASAGLKQAVAACDCLSIHKESFWDIASKIIVKYPESDAVRESLINYHDIEKGWAPTSEEVKGWCEEIVRRQNDPNTPPVTQQWLSQLADHLCGTGEKRR